MSKIKAFFYILSKSITSKSYYSELIERNLSFSLKYYLGIVLFASLITSVYILVPQFSTIRQRADGVLDAVLQAYSDDLVITIQNGELSINQPEPYFIDFPEGFSENLPEHFIVFDSDGTLDDLRKVYDTQILINRTNILVKEAEDRISVEPLANLPDTEFTKETLQAFVATLRRLVPYLLYIALLFIFIGAVFYYSIRIVMVLVVAALLFVLGYIARLGWGFSKYFMVAIHAFTVALVVELVYVVLEAVVEGLPRISGLAFIVNLLVGLWIILPSSSEPISSEDRVE